VLSQPFSRQFSDIENLKTVNPFEICTYPPRILRKKGLKKKSLIISREISLWKSLRSENYFTTLFRDCESSYLRRNFFSIEKTFHSNISILCIERPDLNLLVVLRGKVYAFKDTYCASFYEHFDKQLTFLHHIVFSFNEEHGTEKEEESKKCSQAD
jgi:hypothetical protein